MARVYVRPNGTIFSSVGVASVVTFGTGFWRVNLSPSLPTSCTPVVTPSGASPDGVTGYTGPATATIRFFFGSALDIQLWNPTSAVDTGFTMAIYC